MSAKKYFDINHGIYYYPLYNKQNLLLPITTI